MENSGSASSMACPGSEMEIRHAAQIVVVGVEAFGRLALRAFDLRLLELRRDRADDARGDLVLQIEDVVEGAFEALRPEMGPGRRIDELAGDTDAVAALRTLPSST